MFRNGKVLREYDNGTGDKYLTTQHERDQETGLDYRGARYYDSDVARFLSIDPWANKYPAWSTYNYVIGNPVKFVDPTGKGPTDWFFNPQTGNVIYIKGKSTVEQSDLDKLHSPFSPSDYKRLGGDGMFGSNVQNGSGENVLDKDVHLIKNPIAFLKKFGYFRAREEVVKETTLIDKSPEPDGNITSETKETKVLSSEFVYVKKSDIGKEEIYSKEENVLVVGVLKERIIVKSIITDSYGVLNSSSNDASGRIMKALAEMSEKLRKKK